MKTFAFAIVTSLICGAAVATPLTAQQILTQFNLVTLGNATSSSHVDGRSFIGGTLTGGDFAQHPGDIAASSYAGLTVMQSAANVHVNSNGAVVLGNLSNSAVQNGGVAAVLGNASGSNFNVAAYVAGSSSGNNFNGGHLNSAPATVAAASSTNFGSVLSGLSGSLSHLASTGSSVSLNGNRATFNAIANAQGLAVFDLTAIDTQVFSKGEFAFNLNGATTVVFNVDATSLNFSSNFLGGSAQALGANAIWNFYDATALTINNQFGGTVLAPLANLTNGNNIEGAVLVDTLTQRGEIHANRFTGSVVSVSAVPEPETYALMLGGLALLSAVARRRRG